MTRSDKRGQRVTAIRGGCRRIPVCGEDGATDPLDVLKNQLLAQEMAAVRNVELMERLRRAADESTSLAWATGFPLLTLPELLREKAVVAHAQYERQRRIQSRGRSTVQLAA